MRDGVPYEYPAHYEERLVFSGGDLSWRGQRPFVGKALAGRRIGLLEIDDGIWRMHYRALTIGLLDERAKEATVRPIPTANVGNETTPKEVREASGVVD